MIIGRFILLWLFIGGGIAALLFGWKTITKSEVVSTFKLVTASVLAFIIAMTIFYLET